MNEQDVGKHCDWCVGDAGCLGYCVDSRAAGANWPFPIVNGQQTQASVCLSQRKKQSTRVDLSDIGDALY